MLRSNSKSLRNHLVSPEEEKERLHCAPITTYGYWFLKASNWIRLYEISKSVYGYTSGWSKRLNIHSIKRVTSSSGHIAALLWQPFVVVQPGCMNSLSLIHKWCLHFTTRCTAGYTTGCITGCTTGCKVYTPCNMIANQKISREVPTRRNLVVI